MSLMTGDKAQEIARKTKWREEAYALRLKDKKERNPEAYKDILLVDFINHHTIDNDFIKGYVVGRKKAQEEIDAIIEFKNEILLEKNNQIRELKEYKFMHESVSK